VHVFAVGLGFMLVAWPALRILNYASMSTAMPLADDLLATWDRALGLDWNSYLRFMDSTPVLLTAAKWAYQGLTLYCIAAFTVLLIVHGARRARDFILMFFIAAIVTCATGWLLPSLGPMAQYGFDPASFTHIRWEHGTWPIEPLTRVREGAAQTLSLDEMPGITSIPSFHTAMGLICLYCCHGYRPLFVAALAINSPMLAATPIFGGHYFVDLIAGAFLAALTIVLVAALTAPRSPALEALPARY
jgi:membrane-associated phospholipid phosphatase